MRRSWVVTRWAAEKGALTPELHLSQGDSAMDVTGQAAGKIPDPNAVVWELWINRRDADGQELASERNAEGAMSAVEFSGLLERLAVILPDAAAALGALPGGRTRAQIGDELRAWLRGR